MSVCLFDGLYCHFSVCLFIRLSVCLFIRLSVCLFIRLSVCLSARLLITNFCRNSLIRVFLKYFYIELISVLNSQSWRTAIFWINSIFRFEPNSVKVFSLWRNGWRLKNLLSSIILQKSYIPEKFEFQVLGQSDCSDYILESVSGPFFTCRETSAKRIRGIWYCSQMILRLSQVCSTLTDFAL